MIAAEKPTAIEMREPSRKPDRHVGAVAVGAQPVLRARGREDLGVEVGRRVLGREPRRRQRHHGEEDQDPEAARPGFEAHVFATTRLRGRPRALAGASAGGQTGRSVAAIRWPSRAGRGTRS